MLHKFLSKIRDSIASCVLYRLTYSERARQLTDLTIHSTQSAVSDIQGSNVEVIVSLTTHGRRIYEVYLAIESIIQGSVRPNRIILWLPNVLCGKELPQTLVNQKSRGLEIKYTEDLGPYTKLIPALNEYPDSIIVTIDDDILYPYDTLELLLSAHRSYTDCICANRIMDIKFDNQGQLTSLPTWKELEDKDRISTLNFFEGVGGVLYPPRCFSADVFDQDIFKEICPTADDVWFNCMALLSGISVAPANLHYPHFPLLINESVQDSALWRFNNKKSHTPNDDQLKKVLKKYNLSYGK